MVREAVTGGRIATTQAPTGRQKVVCNQGDPYYIVYHTILYYAMLCYAMLCYAML